MITIKDILRKMFKWVQWDEGMVFIGLIIEEGAIKKQVFSLMELRLAYGLIMERVHPCLMNNGNLIMLEIRLCTNHGLPEVQIQEN